MEGFVKLEQARLDNAKVIREPHSRKIRFEVKDEFSDHVYVVVEVEASDLGDMMAGDSWARADVWVPQAEDEIERARRLA